MFYLIHTIHKGKIFYSVSKSPPVTDDCGILGCIDDYLDFEEFDNINGVNKTIVPNIVHLVYLNEPLIKFYQMICIFSIYFNHKPELIYFHCDNCSFHGKYWEKIISNEGLRNIIKLHQIPFHERIFGKKYGWVQFHRSDVWRLQVLMNYGGYYFDNDVYVIQSLQKYRKYEMTLEWNEINGGIGCQVRLLIKAILKCSLSPLKPIVLTCLILKISFSL